MMTEIEGETIKCNHQILGIKGDRITVMLGVQHANISFYSEVRNWV
jgi:hypothetical protein